MASSWRLKSEATTNSDKFRPQVKELDVTAPLGLLEFIGGVDGQAGGDLSPLELVELGSVYVNAERVMNPSRRLTAGETVRIHASPRRFHVPDDLAARVIEETSDRLVVDKPADLPTEATVDNFRENLVYAVGELRGQNLFVVNSLETESPGLVMLAKTLEARATLKRAFAEEKVLRKFVAFTSKELRVADYPGFEVTACEALVGATDVVSAGRLSWKIEGASVALAYRVCVETKGRPSRVREGLASIGAPILGDAKNGSDMRLIDADSGRPSIALVQTSF